MHYESTKRSLYFGDNTHCFCGLKTLSRVYVCAHGQKHQTDHCKNSKIVSRQVVVKKGPAERGWSCSPHNKQNPALVHAEKPIQVLILSIQMFTDFLELQYTCNSCMLSF